VRETAVRRQLFSVAFSTNYCVKVCCRSCDFRSSNENKMKLEKSERKGGKELSVSLSRQYAVRGALGHAGIR